MASSSASWIPPQGRHRVNVGSSLGRALKARKLNGEAPAVNPKRSNLPDRDFYSFRYNFKPPSLDSTKPATIEFKKSDTSNASTVVAEHPSTQHGERHVCVGSETPLNKLDCVLIYDEETGTFTLEKLDACLKFTWDKKMVSSAPRRASPVPSTSTANATFSSSHHDNNIDHDILGLVDDDAEGEIDDDIKAILPKSAITSRREEEEEESDFDIPLRKKPPQKQQEKPARPVKPMPKVRAKQIPSQLLAPPKVSTPTTAPAPPPPRAKPVPINKGKRPQREPEPPIIDVDEEVLQFGKPAKPARPTVSQPPPQPPALALPGASSSYPTLPPAPLTSRERLSKTAKPAVPPPPPPSPPAQPPADLSESEEEWDEVETTNDVHNDVSMDNDEISMLENEIFGGGGGEGDDDEFQRQLELEMQMDMEGLEDEYAEEPEVPDLNDGPISMKALAGAGGGGAEMDVSDDDFSSSDESDD